MKVILFANTDWYLYNFRLSLARELREQGHTVILLSPNGPYGSRLTEMGFHWLCFPLSRRSLDPFREIATIVRLVRLYRREKPDLVHHFTIKCVLYGSAAAVFLGMRQVVNSVTGLGFVFTEGKNRGWLRNLIGLFYRLLLKRTWIIFQNPDDQAYFLANGFSPRDRTALIPGSGTDVDLFQPGADPDGVPLVVLPARLLWDKGIADFVAAAMILKGRDCKARFALVGESDDGNPAAIPAAQVAEWVKTGVIESWGWQDDMLHVYRAAHIVCLPSYREGLPKTLVEAAACGKPLVATDIPGSREVVEDGKNGLLVPSHDRVALADALQELIDAPDLCKQMGKASRERAVRLFSNRIIVDATMRFYSRVMVE